jgi:hypothetical protein
VNRTIVLALLGATAGCAVGAMKAPFTSSSLDSNNGRPHEVALASGDLDAVVDRLIVLARQRDLTLVKQSGPGHKPQRLAFRGKPVDRRVFLGTRSVTLSYYSRYFVELEGIREGIKVRAVGVPVLGGEMACPGYIAARLRCSPPELNSPSGAGLVADVKRTWGFDVSGAGEAETLEGLLAELGRGAGAPRTAGAAAAAAPPRAIIVAVFDIEDRTSLLTPATGRQLSEYLAAQVTRHAGYQVVPRHQLRARLARQKTESYKACYDQRCQIELGKAVAAERSLATTLLRVGEQCVLSSMLFDLKTETTVRAATVKMACSDEAFLSGVERLARELSGQRARGAGDR